MYGLYDPLLFVGVLPAAVVSRVLLTLYKFQNPSNVAARHPPAAIQTVGTASDLIAP